ncbi:MAG: hypothetical protein GXP47_02715 [Acidobacteria bacterium]|nr:hypothetical protein [Acidobacteriota bacterium]
MLTALGVERYGFLVKSMTAELKRCGETASRWLARGTGRHQEDMEHRKRLDEVDRAIATMAGATR